MARGAKFPGRRITMGASNHCGRGPKSYNNVTSTFFSSTFASERPQVRTWGRQTCFLPRRHLTSLRPWYYWRNCGKFGCVSVKDNCHKREKSDCKIVPGLGWHRTNILTLFKGNNRGQWNNCNNKDVDFGFKTCVNGTTKFRYVKQNLFSIQESSQIVGIFKWNAEIK